MRRVPTGRKQRIECLHETDITGAACVRRSAVAINLLCEPLCPLCLCGLFWWQYFNHRDTEDTEVHRESVRTNSYRKLTPAANRRLPMRARRDRRALLGGPGSLRRELVCDRRRARRLLTPGPVFVRHARAATPALS